MRRSSSSRLLQAAFFPALILLVHLFLAKGTNSYETHPWIDMPMHFLGG
ncbi:MAG: hypothetical protein WD751_09465 [Anaerolineales bacterium]